MTQEQDFIAKASVTVHAPREKVWDALVSPQAIRQYMFGTTVITDWKEGSPIRWKGEWEGKPYEDRGTILKVERGNVLEYSHFSPLSGKPDNPENHHTVTIALSTKGDQTVVTLSQDNNENESARQHSEKNWQRMLERLKEYVEG